MDGIKLDNFDRPEEQEEPEEEEKINVDDPQNESIVIIDASNPDANVRRNNDAMRGADRDLGRGIGVKRLKYTVEKKILEEIGVNINKGDGASSKPIFDMIKITENRKGKVNGAEFDGVRIIVQKGKNWNTQRTQKNYPKLTNLKRS